MTILLLLIPLALLAGLLGLAAILWSLKSGQYEDLEGAAMRILIDEDKPSPPKTALQQQALLNKLHPDAPDDDSSFKRNPSFEDETNGP